jgi:hypothetical protein
MHANRANNYGKSSYQQITMMNKENILKNFDDLVIAKKNGYNYLLLTVLFSFAVIVAVLIWATNIQKNAIGNIKVIDKSGVYLKTSTEREEKLFESLVQNHCSNAVYYINSFNRLTIKENQARAIFLMNQNDALRIFSRYKDNNAYGDALDRNVTYTAVFDQIESISKETEPYHVVFYSTLTISDDDRPAVKFRIRSEGDLIKYTPQYPENTSGLYFKNYVQSYEKLSTDESKQN